MPLPLPLCTVHFFSFLVFIFLPPNFPSRTHYIVPALIAVHVAPSNPFPRVSRSNTTPLLPLPLSSLPRPVLIRFHARLPTSFFSYNALHLRSSIRLTVALLCAAIRLAPGCLRSPWLHPPSFLSFHHFHIRVRSELRSCYRVPRRRRELFT